MFTNAPSSASYSYNLNNTDQSPDGISGYWLRTAPQTVLGVNSQNVVDLGKVTGINPGSPGINYFSAHSPDSHIDTWNVTIEKQLDANTIVKARYVGNHGANLDQYYSYNQNPPDYIWYVTTKQPLPTGTYSSVVRRAFDQTLWGTIQEITKTGYSNYSGMEFELEHRYSKGIGFQLSYVVGNAMAMTTSSNNDTIGVTPSNQFLPGTVPQDFDERNRFLNYQRDTSIPKHRVRWNWVMDLPVGKGKRFAGNTGGVLDKVIGGWQIAGIGTMNTTYFGLPTSNWNFTGEPIHIYGYKYPVQDCRSGGCIPGYLWWNDYIPSNQINSVDAKGVPNGVMGVPSDYKPAVTPLIPWGSTAMPANAPSNTVVSTYWDTNNVWVPLSNGTVQRLTYNNNLHPWRQQYFSSARNWSLDSSLFKNVTLKDRLSLRVGADFFNVLNHPGNPSGISGGILQIRNSGNSARTLQFNARLTW